MKPVFLDDFALVNRAKKRTAAVTGASGMVGNAVCNLIDNSAEWSPAIRVGRNFPAQQANNWRIAPDLAELANWEPVLQGANTVIHCAARAHVLKEYISPQEIEKAYYSANHIGTLQVAKAAIAIGASHFVFVSSAGVVADDAASHPALEIQKYSPINIYASAKQRAEEDLVNLFELCSTKLVIIRPPLVIAKGAPGNVGLLENISKFLRINPFNGIHNQRSVISRTNLASALLTACHLDDSSTEIFHTAEPNTLKTSELIGMMRKAKGNRTVGVPIPAKMVESTFSVFKRATLYDKIFGDFLLNTENASKKLGNFHQNSIEEELTN